MKTNPMIPSLVLISLFKYNENKDSSYLMSLILHAAFVILSCHLLRLRIRKWMTQVDLEFDDLLKLFILPLIYATGFTNDYLLRKLTGEELRNKLILIAGQILSLGIVDTFLQLFSKSKLERNKIAKEHKANLGFGLARCNFSYIENVIKGKKQTPPLSEQLSEYCREQRLKGGHFWIFSKLLILFPEGNYPYQTNGKTWGSMDDILKNKYQESKIQAVRERPEHRYTVSGGIERTSVLDIVRVVKDDTWQYAAYVENRPLISLCKLVDFPVSLESGQAEVMVTREDFKIHFQVYKRELQRLLDDDPYCRGKYEIVHYREKDKSSFGDKLMQIFDRMKRLGDKDEVSPCIAKL